MAKLVVEVLDSVDLMPEDGQGSSNPFVEVEFQGQRHRTATKFEDLNPCWNEKLEFYVKNPRYLSEETIEVSVYNDSKHGHHKNFLGRVRISAMSVPFSEEESVVQRYPLDKRGHFSRVRGDIALRIHAVILEYRPFDLLEQFSQYFNGEVNYPHLDYANIYAKTAESTTIPLVDVNTNKFDDANIYTLTAESTTIPLLEVNTNKFDDDYQYMENPARDNTASTYDLVEQMHFLYVSVVQAKDLPVVDITGSLDPYVEVKVGNYKEVTKHLKKKNNPVWKHVFAFSRERLQSNLIEITVKDKDLVKDDFVGKVLFDIVEIPQRVPPDSPLVPQWHRLVDKKGDKINHGEIMLAVWIGTQADEAFPDAWHSDAHSLNQQSLASTRSKVYLSPKLYYLRVHIIAAHDLVPSDRSRPLVTYVKVQLGHQLRLTRPSPMRHINPEWNEELMFVASVPFDEYIVISVEERIRPDKDEVIGKIVIPVREVPLRLDSAKKLDARWYALLPPPVAEEIGEKKKEVKFASRILLGLCLDSGYHVLDESTHFSSDLQPSSKHLRKHSIGILEVGFLNARNLPPMKSTGGRLTGAYCVAKYGNKWIRTRTILNSLHPRWNEQYTWEVNDPCTVITIGVFDNCHINGKDDARDQRIGKVRIRLSTLEKDRIYTHSYPLLVLSPSGLMKHGELHLAIRFSCTARVNMVTQYGKPLLPKMHYVQPISVRHIDWLRHQAMQIAAAKLSRAEPPLRREIVEHMLDVNYDMWSLRKSKANLCRIKSLLSGVSYIYRWFDDICLWKNPLTTILVHILFLILVRYPELILSTIFLCLFVIGLWNYRYRPRHPLHMDIRLSQPENAYPDELHEEFDTFPTSHPIVLVRMRYDRLRSVAGRVQTGIGDLATQGEMVLSMLSWRDPRATAIITVLALIIAVFLYVTRFQVVAVLFGLYTLRHPRFRSRMPSILVNFFKRLPSKSDSLL